MIKELENAKHSLDNVSQFKDEKITFLENEILQLKDAKAHLINENVKLQAKFNDSELKSYEYSGLKHSFDKILKEKQDVISLKDEKDKTINKQKSDYDELFDKFTKLQKDKEILAKTKKEEND